MGKRGGRLQKWHPVDLLGETLRQLVERSGINPADLDDVIVGCVLQWDQQHGNLGRHAVLAAGLPESVPAVTVDRQCGSGQQAVRLCRARYSSGRLPTGHRRRGRVGVAGAHAAVIQARRAAHAQYSPRELARYQGNPLIPQERFVGVDEQVLKR